MAKKPRSFIGIILIVLLLLVACLIIFFASNYVLSIPGQASEIYGPPSQSLSTLQHYQLSFSLINQERILNSPLDSDRQEIIFVIAAGESPSSILNNLLNAKLISNQDALRNYLIYSGLDTQLQAGSFMLSPAMTPIEIVNSLLDATPQVIEFNILPGWRIEEIAANLPSSGLSISTEEFLDVAYFRPTEIEFANQIPEGISLEGYLLPGSYSVERDISANELLLIFLRAFESEITLDILEAFSHQGLTLQQAVTLASVVERESIVDEEQPAIASVFLNRLAIDMRLESDPTVQYALGYNDVQKTWWTNPISSDQLQIDSAYNTYRYAGLMPSPIANP
ncbi:MAG: endolytic transglycosylase MltG, partial [Chloroflexi bacterium]|nr:endolytic transglycosylase MltG [Chloroflexota bacterium]